MEKGWEPKLQPTPATPATTAANHCVFHISLVVLRLFFLYPPFLENTSGSVGEMNK